MLFDFAGTLFDDTSVLTGPRLARRCAARDVELTTDDAEALCAKIQARVDSPAGRAARQGADRDSTTHRAAWTALAGSVPGVTAPIAAAYYDCITDIRAWRPYLDTASTLAALNRMDIPVAVVSNTGWDITGSFTAAGLAGLVDVFVLSCDIGLEKPHPRVFTFACRALDVEPADAVMVGDDPAKDGGAVAAGIPVYLLPVYRAQHRIRGLAAVLTLVQEKMGATCFANVTRRRW